MRKQPANSQNVFRGSTFDFRKRSIADGTTMLSGAQTEYY